MVGRGGDQNIYLFLIKYPLILPPSLPVTLRENNGIWYLTGELPEHFRSWKSLHTAIMGLFR